MSGGSKSLWAKTIQTLFGGLILLVSTSWKRYSVCVILNWRSTTQLILLLWGQLARGRQGELCCSRAAPRFKRRDGGTGRRSGLKIRRGQPRGGSTPPPGTIEIKSFRCKWPLEIERSFDGCSGGCSFSRVSSSGCLQEVVLFGGPTPRFIRRTT
jgi:hypothetical protein